MAMSESEPDGPSDKARRSQQGRTGEFVFNRDRLETGEFDAITPIPVAPDRYPEPGSFAVELRKTEQLYPAFQQATMNLINGVRMGRSLDIEAARSDVEAMVDSVVRHPDAMLWMSRRHVTDSYLIGHAQRCSILATVMGRTMGLERPQLVRLAWGGLLCQIGKTKLPRKLLERPGPLEVEEMDRIRQFVQLGVGILEDVPLLDSAVIDIVADHHERFDGSGYPNAKAAEQITVLARVVGLADWYDAMTSTKPYTDNSISSTEAMDMLHKRRNRLFQDQLVEIFVKAVGLYPVGSVVALSGGEVAIVEAHHGSSRTQPMVLVVMDDRQRPLDKPVKLDLLVHNRKHPDAPPLTVARALAESDFDLDIPALLAAGQANKRKGWRRLFLS